VLQRLTFELNEATGPEDDVVVEVADFGVSGARDPEAKRSWSVGPA